MLLTSLQGPEKFPQLLSLFPLSNEHLFLLPVEKGTPSILPHLYPVTSQTIPLPVLPLYNKLPELTHFIFRFRRKKRTSVVLENKRTSVVLEGKGVNGKTSDERWGTRIITRFRSTNQLRSSKVPNFPERPISTKVILNHVKFTHED